MRRLSEIARKNERLVVGLTSGTSADGVDAALVAIKGSGLGTEAEVLLDDTFPYPDHVREAVLSASDGKLSVKEICSLNYRLGESFADACLSLLASSRVDPEDVDVIGSHGQTVCHIPCTSRDEKVVTASTLQLAESSIIAQRTGSVVVCDFRSADIAAGGEGAPLAPCVDYILFRDLRASRGFLNVGGIANLSALPAGCRSDEVIGFDTGPGNMVLDYLADRLFKAEYDNGGTRAATGEPSEEIVERLLQLEFFKVSPPKSTGRELFGSTFSERLITIAEEDALSKEDMMATAVMLTTCSIHRAYVEFVAKSTEIEELYVSGGGVENRTLMHQLEEVFSPIPVYTIDRLGVPAQAKEALLFAVLANQAIAGEPSSLPQVTGATRKTILGKIIQ
ncbi:MAG: anhydro-N-acetylmuramic acid kinase [bacterium]